VVLISPNLVFTILIFDEAIKADDGHYGSGGPFSSWHFSRFPWHFSLLAASGQNRTLLRQNSPEEWVQ